MPAEAPPEQEKERDTELLENKGVELTPEQLADPQGKEREEINIMEVDHNQDYDHVDHEDSKAQLKGEKRTLEAPGQLRAMSK